MRSNALNSRGKPAVSPMSGAPTFDIEKKPQKRGEFKTPPRPTGRRSNYYGKIKTIPVPIKIRKISTLWIFLFLPVLMTRSMIDVKNSCD